MANTIRIKRRASGNVGAPTSLANAELAFNEVDDTLYYGKGSGGAGGTATTVEAIAGKGAFATLTTAQTISGNKTFTGTVSLGSSATATTPGTSDNSTTVATTAYVKAQNYLTGNQSITVSGDASGSGTTAISLTLASVGTAGTYTKVTTDAKGRVTSGTTLSASDIPTLTAAKISDFDTQVRTNRLDQMASPTAAVSFNSQRLTNLSDPSSAQDAATKAYVDAARTGLDVKESVRVIAKSNITLSGTQTIDGVSVVAGNRVLVVGQTTQSQNGIYVVAAGAWSRATDADTSAEVTSGMFTFVEEGTLYAATGWVLKTTGAITLNTTSLEFVQFSSAGVITAGDGLTQVGTTFHVVVGTGLTSTTSVNLDGQVLALHNLSTNGFFVRTGSGTVAARSITSGTTGLSISNGDGVSGNPSISLTNILGPLGALTAALDSFPYINSSGTASNASLTAFGRSLVDDADAAAARTTLGLGTMATQNANSVAITGGSIDNVTFDGGTF